LQKPVTHPQLQDLQVRSGWRGGSRQDFASQSILSQNLPTRLQGHNWSGLRGGEAGRVGSSVSASNLGHGRPGEVSQHRLSLLPRRSRRDRGIRPVGPGHTGPGGAVDPRRLPDCRRRVGFRYQRRLPGEVPGRHQAGFDRRHEVSNCGCRSLGSCRPPRFGVLADQRADWGGRCRAVPPGRRSRLPGRRAARLRGGRRCSLRELRWRRAESGICD
uniref:Translation elongation factor 1-alpha n=2 Tax=Macrostomum lignano TaxID=282301 RepID=A0A1I8GFR3_9PLAT